MQLRRGRTRSRREPAERPFPRRAPILALQRVGWWKALLGLVAAALLVLGVVLLIAKLAGYSNIVDSLRDADPGWVVVAIVAEMVAIAAYITAFRALVRFDGGPRIGVWLSTQTVFASLGATRLLAAAGAGGLAVSYWALRRLGFARHAAITRVLGFNVWIFVLFGAIVAAAAVAVLLGAGGLAPSTMAWLWLFGIVACFVGGVWVSSRPGQRGRWAGARFTRARIDTVRGLLMTRQFCARPLQSLGLLVGGAFYWVGDALCLWASLHAFGVDLPTAAFIIAYATGYVSITLPLPAGGLGTVDAAITAALVVVGAPLGPTLLGVLVYRFCSFALPTLPGLTALSTLPRLGRQLTAMRPRAAASSREGIIELAHAQSASAVVSALRSDERLGLTEAEAAARLERVGLNRAPGRERPRYLAIASRQLIDPLVALLVAAVAVSAAIGDRIEAAAIGVILLLNTVLGFAQEAAAERAVLALRLGFPPMANVVRDGHERKLPAERIVPGDVVVLREGERVPADARLVEAYRLEADESPLTGESLPVPKGVAEVPGETPLADRTSLVYTGTSITRGRARGIVTATGEATELGKISQLAGSTKPPQTRLQGSLARLAQTMVLLGLTLTVVLATVMFLRGSPVHEAFLLGVAVAVAAVPEGLVAALTIALAVGARIMARRGAVVRRLAAIETIGETTVICTDKTGTLTENRLRLASVLPVEGVSERELLEAAVLASSAELIEDGGHTRVAGDPVEGALLLAAKERGLGRAALLETRAHLYEVPFAPERKQMGVIYQEHGRLRAFVKGAPEVLFQAAAVSDEDRRRRLGEVAAAWASEGLRVLTVGERVLPGGYEIDVDESVLDHDIALLGIVALRDPLRPEASMSIAQAQEAGVRVEMLTGDHPSTATAVGQSLGLAQEAIHARVTPEGKLQLVESLQAGGEVVAVTGDGVNDAPALRRADVGIAMGGSGTDVAREASSIVLTDDNFATIVAALGEGRRVGENIRKVIAFLLSANFGEVVLFAVAVIAGLGAPMTVVQILTVNVVTDGLPALALAYDPASPSVMKRGPRRLAGLFTRSEWRTLAASGAMVGVAGLAAHTVGRAFGGGSAQTMAYATIALGELAFAFAIRSLQAPAWRLAANLRLFGAVVVSALFVVVTVYVPAFHEPFGTVSLSAEEAVSVLGFALVPFVFLEAAKLYLRATGRARLPAS